MYETLSRQQGLDLVFILSDLLAIDAGTSGRVDEAKICAIQDALIVTFGFNDIELDCGQVMAEYPNPCNGRLHG